VGNSQSLTVDLHASAGRTRLGMHTASAPLAFLFMAEAIVAKSRFATVVGGWTGHMVLTVAFLGLFLLLGLSEGRAVVTPPRSVRRLLGAALAWAFLCCIAQPNAWANLAFLCVQATNVYVSVFLLPRLVLPYLGRRAVLLYATPLFAAAGLCLVAGSTGAAGSVSNERLAGVMGNATHSGGTSAVACVAALWCLAMWPRRRLLWLACLVVSLAALVLTRTRASLFGMLLAFAAMAALWGTSPSRAARRVSISLFAVSLVAVLLGVGSAADLLPKVREYFRVDASVGDLAEGRMRYWRFAIADVKKNWLFGRGPMAKFGDGTDVTTNTYAIDKNPHNTWLIVAQSYGLFGAVLFVAIIMVTLTASLHGRTYMPTLAVGIVMLGIGMSVAENWSFSFGNETDRASWLLLGLALAVPCKGSGKQQDWATPRCRYTTQRSMT